MTTKTITIKYFAILREQAGKSDELYQTNCISCLDLYKELKLKYDFSLSLDQIKVSINNQFKDLQSTFNEGDLIVFIPPVAGG